MTRSFALLLLTVALAMNSLDAVAADPKAAQLTYEPWVKMCFGGAHCVVATGARGKCYPSGGALAVNIPEGRKWSLSVSLGTTRPPEGAINVQIDQADPITIIPSHCYASGCGGELDIDSTFVERLKHSQRITIEATDTVHQKHSLSFSLAGYAQAFDGPGRTEPKVIEEIVSNKEMNERLEKAEKENPPSCEE